MEKVNFLIICWSTLLAQQSGTTLWKTTTTSSWHERTQNRHRWTCRQWVKIRSFKVALIFRILSLSHFPVSLFSWIDWDFPFRNVFFVAKKRVTFQIEFSNCNKESVIPTFFHSTYYFQKKKKHDTHTRTCDLDVDSLKTEVSCGSKGIKLASFLFQYECKLWNHGLSILLAWGVSNLRCHKSNHRKTACRQFFSLGRRSVNLSDCSPAKREFELGF